MGTPLHIPHSKKWKGLVVFCYKCKTNVSEICKETNKPVQKCPFGDRHTFKVYVHVPGTDNARRTKRLNTRNVNEAIKQAMEFEKEVKEGSHHADINEDTSHDNKIGDSGSPRILSHVLARYIGFLHNESVPTHRQKVRSENHIKDVERALKMVADCLKQNEVNVNHILIDQLNDKMVGMIYDYMEKEKKFSPRSVNKYLSYLTSMMKWYVDEYDVPIKNWFERARRNKVVSNPEAITKEEFESLLKQITPENGVKDYGKGKKPVRNLFRLWLAYGLRLALETGRRREEVINLKFDNIVNDLHGNSYIKVEDYKVNRIQKLTAENEKKYIYIPITDNLKKLLFELGYDDYKNSGNYILAPEIKNSRTRVMADLLSKGFSHYYSQLNTGRKLTFKSLRKAYITAMQIHTGGNAKSVTGHSDNAVIEKHYIDREAVAKSVKGFQVFADETERKNALEEVRDNSKTKQKTLEV